MPWYVNLQDESKKGLLQAEHQASRKLSVSIITPLKTNPLFAKKNQEPQSVTQSHQERSAEERAEFLEQERQAEVSGTTVGDVERWRWCFFSVVFLFSSVVELKFGVVTCQIDEPKNE